MVMETITEELILHEPDKIESIEDRIAELDKYKIELKVIYKKLSRDFPLHKIPRFR